MIGGVTKKNARCGPIFEFMNGGRRDEWIAKAPEGAKMVIGGVFVV